MRPFRTTQLRPGLRRMLAGGEKQVGARVFRVDQAGSGVGLLLADARVVGDGDVREAPSVDLHSERCRWTWERRARLRQRLQDVAPGREPDPEPAVGSRVNICCRSSARNATNAQ